MGPAHCGQSAVLYKSDARFQSRETRIFAMDVLGTRKLAHPPRNVPAPFYCNTRGTRFGCGKVEGCLTPAAMSDYTRQTVGAVGNLAGLHTVWYSCRSTGAGCAGSPRLACRSSGRGGSERPCRGVAQPGSAPGSGPGGRRFKSSRPDHSFQWDTAHFWCFVYSGVDDFVDEFAGLSPQSETLLSSRLTEQWTGVEGKAGFAGLPQTA